MSKSFSHKRITLINIYGPNVDTPCFYNKVADVIENFDNQSCILCGDFNLIQNIATPLWLDANELKIHSPCH
jgi:hypothetical protein